MTTATGNLRVNIDRLSSRIEALGTIGALPGGGVCRLALTDEDRQGRDLVVGWMRELGLVVSIDRIGNVWGVRPGKTDGRPVLIGSHLDTVATGGLYDGSLGVLAGLEVVACLDDAGISTRHPVAVAFFTNEEGVRFTPDMMGSAVHQGSLPLDTALATVGFDNTRLGAELKRIGYDGDADPAGLRPRVYLELHIEQGPLLERDGIAIGAVTGVQGISWMEFTVTGVANHAGTTPMSLRCDAGLVAAKAVVAARETALDLGGSQVATVGSLTLSPGLVNVVPETAVFTVDLRNTDTTALKEAEWRVAEAIKRAAASEGAAVTSRALARFDPVEFDPDVVNRIETAAGQLGHSVRRMPSGAGHDAQMFAPHCPTAMIFVPSRDGLSHNVREYTSPEQLQAGADVLLQVAVQLANEE